ncbi:Domain of unknown function DUF4776 [Cinara cedri]|uniref:DUF4776 domain-containing protein n=1 Tax=Cinara cedri TaxID=506608 RepID=A0A5E4M575_9HEMI|nr:Domain of unknown function DUF4776 [Cinara cedri]
MDSKLKNILNMNSDKTPIADKIKFQKKRTKKKNSTRPAGKSVNNLSKKINNVAGIMDSNLKNILNINNDETPIADKIKVQKQLAKKKNSTRPAGKSVNNLSKKINNVAGSVYPGVNCGHKNCISQPVVTPGNMGWLWSLKDAGGVKINRNWRPGAIPKNVVLMMEKAKAAKLQNMNN